MQLSAFDAVLENFVTFGGLDAVVLGEEFPYVEGGLFIQKLAVHNREPGRVCKNKMELQFPMLPRIPQNVPHLSQFLKLFQPGL